MIPAPSHSAAHRVGESFSGANVAKQARRKSSTESFVEYRGREVIGIPARNAQRNHMNVALIHVGFVDLVISRFGGFWLDLWIDRGLTLGPRRKSLAQTSFHLRRVEIADDAEDDVIRMHVPAVPLGQILTRDCRYSCILRHPRIRIVCAIDQLRRLPSRNLRGIVI